MWGVGSRGVSLRLVGGELSEGAALLGLLGLVAAERLLDHLEARGAAVGAAAVAGGEHVPALSRDLEPGAHQLVVDRADGGLGRLDLGGEVDDRLHVGLVADVVVDETALVRHVVAVDDRGDNIRDVHAAGLGRLRQRHDLAGLAVVLNRDRRGDRRPLGRRHDLGDVLARLAPRLHPDLVPLGLHGVPPCPP